MAYFNKHLPSGVEAVHKRAGWGTRQGFGERPAILVIDMAYAWTDPESEMGKDMSDTIANINKVLAASRQAKPAIPVIFTVIEYVNAQEISPAVMKKTKNIRTKYMIKGSRWTEIDSKLDKQPNDILMIKKHSSCFVMTNLIELLIFQRVDTLIITGCSTSGCVQATAYDANAYGFYAIVPEQAVDDRDPVMANFALFNIDAKYGDVVSLDETIKYLSKFKG